MPGYHWYLLRGGPALGQTTERGFKASRRRRAGKQALLDDGVDAPVAVDHLGDAEVDADGHERDRLILAQSLGGHQKTAHLAERIPQREIDRGFFVDILLRRGTELLKIIGEAEAVHHPLVLGFEQWVVQPGERTSQRILLVQDELEGSSQRHF